MVNNLLDSSISKSDSRKKFEIKKVSKKRKSKKQWRILLKCVHCYVFLSKKMPFVPLWPMQTSSDYNTVGETYTFQPPYLHNTQCEKLRFFFANHFFCEIKLAWWKSISRNFWENHFPHLESLRLNWGTFRFQTLYVVVILLKNVCVYFYAALQAFGY